MLYVLVFSVDYSDELDILVSGFADFVVKVWVLFVGICLNIFIGYIEWVIKVGRLRNIFGVRFFIGGEWRMVDLCIL